MAEPADAQVANDEAAPPEIGGGDVRSAVIMGVIFVGTILLAMLLAEALHTEIPPAFENPDDPTNPLLYLVLVIVFTFAILLVAKLGLQKIIQYVILGAVFLTLAYVYQPMLVQIPGVSFTASLGASLVGSGVLVGLLYYYPEWYVVDLAGIATAAAATGLFGFSFGIVPALVLLVAFAVYDFIAVYRTKHMIDLADQVMDLRLPVMLVIPKVRGYSFLEGARFKDPDRIDEPPWRVAPEPSEDDGSRDALFMGLGDIVIPGVLVVSSLIFLRDQTATVEQAAGLAPELFVALSTLVGATLGFGVLMWAVLKGKPHAGLPALNGGALIGFLAPLLAYYGTSPLIPQF